MDNTSLMLRNSCAPPAVPANWDFSTADKDFDKQIFNWRRLSLETMKTLWVFYNKLARPGKRTDLSQNCEGLPSWGKWLESKGISVNTPTNHFKALGWLESGVHVAHNSGENEWYTPPKYIEAAKAVMETIDTDPASSATANETVGAKTFYTVDDNGLDKKWGKNVWMNPPYAQPLVRQFCDTFADKYETGEVKQGCVLINNVTETAFGQRLMAACSAACFPSGRVKFLDIEGKPGAPLQGQMLLYFGRSATTFISAYSGIGVCFKK